MPLGKEVSKVPDKLFDPHREENKILRFLGTRMVTKHQIWCTPWNLQFKVLQIYSLCWDVTQRRLAVRYRRFGTTYRSTRIGRPETSSNYHSTLRDISEHRKSHTAVEAWNKDALCCLDRIVHYVITPFHFLCHWPHNRRINRFINCDGFTPRKRTNLTKLLGGEFDTSFQ